MRALGLILGAGITALATTLVAPAVALEGEIDPRAPETVDLRDTSEAHYRYRQQQRRALPPEERLEERVLSRLCNVDSEFLEPEIGGECAPSNGTVPVPGCDGADPVLPLWYRSRPSTTSEWSVWEMVVGWSCPADLLPTLTQEELRRLRIDPAPAHRQPNAPQTLVNKDLIVYTERAEQRFRTTIFDYAIDVVVTPATYSWDFGDGTEPLVTASPGAPYPSFELTHRYAEPLTASVTLTTTWTARFRVDDPHGEWQDVEGTAVTTMRTDEFEVIELRSHLDG